MNVSFQTGFAKSAFNKTAVKIVRISDIAEYEKKGPVTTF